MMDHRRLSKRPAFLGLAVNLLKTLSDDQVQELARNMARDQRELEDEMLAGTEQETARAGLKEPPCGFSANIRELVVNSEKARMIFRHPGFLFGYAAIVKRSGNHRPR